MTSETDHIEWTISTPLEITIPSKAKTEDLVIRGHYAHINANINSHTFPLNFVGPRKVCLVRFARAMLSQEVEHAVAEIPAATLAPIDDLLTLLADESNAKSLGSNKIACLGSWTVSGADRLVPCFYGKPKHKENKGCEVRCLDLWRYSSRWSSSWEYLLSCSD